MWESKAKEMASTRFEKFGSLAMLFSLFCQAPVLNCMEAVRMVTDLRVSGQMCSVVFLLSLPGIQVLLNGLIGIANSIWTTLCGRSLDGLTRNSTWTLCDARMLAVAVGRTARISC